MRHTHQQPFSFDLRQTAQQELANAANVFEVSEDRFDDHFSSAEYRAPFFAPQLLPHSVLHPHGFHVSLNSKL